MRIIHFGPGRAAEHLKDVVGADNQNHHRHVDERVQAPVDICRLGTRPGIQVHVPDQERDLGPCQYQADEPREKYDENQQQVQHDTAPPPRHQRLPAALSTTSPPGSQR